MCLQGNNHIVYTNRENIPDMKAITGTQKFSQVQAYSDTNKKLISSYRPCSCINCLLHIGNFQDCFYNKERSISTHTLKQKINNQVAGDNPTVEEQLHTGSIVPNDENESDKEVGPDTDESEEEDTDENGQEDSDSGSESG